MSRYVVDASIAVKWFLPEIHAEAALRLLSGGHDLLVPDLLYSEVGNVLWKQVRAGNIQEAEAKTALQALGNLPLQVQSSWPLVMAALEIACRMQRTVYDSLYLALAVSERAVMVTADEKFYNIIHSGTLSSYLVWIEDI